MDEASKIDVVGFLDWFYRTFGPGWTLALIFAVPLVIVGWQVIQAFRKDREANLALSAKEDTIQMLAQENRLYRIQFFKDKWGWTDQQIEKWVLKNEPPAKKK